MMDSVCCDTGREKTVPHGENASSSLHRMHAHKNVINSPSWSFQSDSRSHMGNIIDGCLQFDPYVVSNSANTTGESKGDTLSNGVSPIESFQTPSWPKSPVLSDAVEDFAPGGLDIHLNPSASNKASTDDYMKRHATEDKLEKTVVFSASIALEPMNEPSSSSSRSSLEPKNEPSSSRSPLEPKNEPSSSRSPTFVPNLTPSRGSPKHPLSRQISDSWILAHESLRSSASERGPSFVLSACSNDMTLGSHGGSSDGWSMGRSFDNENTNSIPERIRSDDMHFSPPLDSRSCELCLKNLEDVSPFICCGTDIVSVLVCGHLYHAECLEGVTPDAHKFDPRCPICSSTGTLSWRKFVRRNFSSIRYEDSERFMVSRHGGRGSKMAASSSTSVSFTKAFLRRRFPFGGRASRTLWSTTLRAGRASGQGTSRNKSICR